MVTTRGKLLRTIDEARIKEAIRHAEEKTSGEIRVSVSSLIWGDVRKAAEKAFVRMNMRATEQRNGVLIFIVPSRRQFVVLGDTGIHEKVGQEFWHGIARTIAEKFRTRDFTEGLISGITMAGVQLAKHFPSSGAKDVNELSDDVDRDA
jgi:uncharacterized membrane protein